MSYLLARTQCWLLADSCKAKAGVSQDEARGSLAVGTGLLRQDQA